MENSFSYDAAGRVTEIVKAGNSPVLTGKTAYTYDALGRLLRVQDGQRTESYAYDALGNRTARSVDGILKAAYQYNERNQLTGRTENDTAYHYSYDRRGNLTEERRGDALIRQYLYDATNHLHTGKNLESGEKTEYGYNGLYMRVKNTRTLQNRRSRYSSHAVQTENMTGTPFLTRETEYVTDFLSNTNNELMAYEKGFGAIRTTFGPGYGRLSQKTTPEQESPRTARDIIAGSCIGKAYFQPDLKGSVLFAADEQGRVLRYGERNTWGELKLPVQEEMNISGLEENLRYTTYSHDPVIDKHFAHARMYDADAGRMLAPDPVKRSLNGYPYCDNDPVNHEDPTGELPTALVGALAGGFIGGLSGFAGEALSQLGSGKKFDIRQALGSAANGAIVGAVKGAFVGSGAGIGLSLAADFLAGTAGSAAEQKITTGRVDAKRSITGGLTNTVSGLIYGNTPLKSAKQAFIKGAASGAATSGISYIADALSPETTTSGLRTGREVITFTSPYARQTDPRSSCHVPEPFTGNMGYSTAYGYRYDEPQSSGKEPGGFSIADFCKEVVIGGAVGGLAGGAFYGAGKAFESVKRSVGSARKTSYGKSRGNTFESSYHIPTDSNGYTKSNLKLGRDVHKEYKLNEVDLITKFKEYRLPSKKRIDFIDFETKTIYELKPYNPNQIKNGTKQLEGYLEEVESLFGPGWTTVLDTY